jgi:hypothetical protein
MALKIMPHGRLQEWVADEKGFFAAEGLGYSFLVEGDYGIHAVRRDDSGEIKSGALIGNGIIQCAPSGAQPAMVPLPFDGGPVLRVSPVKASKNKITNPP